MATYQRTKHQPETAKQAKTNKPEHAASQKVNPQQMLAAPDTLRPEDVLAAQQQLGNQVVQRALDNGDQRRGLTDAQGNLRDDISSSIQQSRGSGSSLPKELQTEVGRKLGHDFSNVRLHTDEKADKLSRTINARAFTIGSDIYFKGGVFAPSTREGRETLIHELTHVVQQSRSSASSGKLKLGSPHSAMEKEADTKGKQGSQSTLSASAGAVQRVEDEEEIQMQSEEEEIQMQSEEEEIQMQSEEEEIQMQSEEEEIQMQPEEEEIQMQPDAGGVVQRGILDWFKKKKDPNAIPTPPPLPQQSTAPVKPRGKPLTAKGQQVVDKLKTAQPSGDSFRHELRKKRKAMGFSSLSSQEEKAKKDASFTSLDEEQQHRLKRDTSSGVNSKAMVQSSERAKLIHTLKNPNSTPEQMKEAEDKLRTFHKSGKFKKNPATIALKERKKALKESARGGDQKAAELYKKENPGFLTKAGNFFGKVGDFYGKHKSKFETATSALGKVGGLLGLGTSQKEESKTQGGGGGGDGGYAVIISQLMQENKMLKEKLAEK
jgi:hypothetical protein